MLIKYKMGELNQVPDGKGKAFTVNGKSVAVFHIGGKYYAVSNVCTHKGFPIDEGPMDGCIVTCPYHGAQFDVRTGETVSPPATTPLLSFKTFVEGNDLYIEM